MNKQLLVALALIVVAASGFGLWTVIDKGDDAATEAEQVSQTEKKSSDNANDLAGGTQLAAFTKENVAEHAAKTDCWTIVSGKVYDITSYVPRHPGGDEILMACGTDGTSLFTKRETTTGKEVGSGTPHSSNAASQLESLLMGDLTDKATPTPSDPATPAVQ